MGNGNHKQGTTHSCGVNRRVMLGAFVAASSDSLVDVHYLWPGWKLCQLQLQVYWKLVFSALVNNSLGCGNFESRCQGPSQKEPVQHSGGN